MYLLPIILEPIKHFHFKRGYDYAMHKWLLTFGFLMFSTSQASTGVSCLLKTQLTGLTQQPFTQRIAHVKVQEAKNNLQARNDVSCPKTFSAGMPLLIDISPKKLKHNETKKLQYSKGQILYFKFSYFDGLSSDGISMNRVYNMISVQEYNSHPKAKDDR